MTQNGQKKDSTTCVNGKRAAKRPRKSMDLPPTPKQDNRLGLFTVEHLTILIDYLKKNGFDGDCQPLCNLIPNYTEGSFKSFFSLMSRAGPEVAPGKEDQEAMVPTEMRRRNKGAPKMAPVEQWIDLVKDMVEVQRTGGSPMLILEWIANYTDHPDPASCCNVDYKAIYLYIAALLEGKIPKQLNPPTASKLYLMYEQLVSTISESAKSSQDLLLKTVKLPTTAKIDRDEKNRILRERRRAEWTAEELQQAETVKGDDMEAIKKIYCDKPGLNPFSFPPTI